MKEGQLQEIKERYEAPLRRTFPLDAMDYAEQATSDVRGLVAEVERLEGRLQAVCDVLSDADACDGVIDTEKVMEAVRGYRRATHKEMVDRIKTAPREILEWWIQDARDVFIRPNGMFVLEGEMG